MIETPPNTNTNLLVHRQIAKPVDLTDPGEVQNNQSSENTNIEIQDSESHKHEEPNNLVTNKLEGYRELIKKISQQNPLAKKTGEVVNKIFPEADLADKILGVTTLGSAGVNLISIASKLSGKSDFNKIMDQAGLNTVKLTAMAQGIHLINQGCQNKELPTLGAGLAKFLQTFFDFRLIPTVSGIATGLDQIPLSINSRLKRMGEDTNFISWGDGAIKSFKALKNIYFDFVKSPVNYIKEALDNNDKTGKSDELLSILSLGMIGGAALGLNKGKILGPLIRHATGSASDFILTRNDSNPSTKQSGKLYIAGAVADSLGAIVNNYFMHHLSTIFNQAGDLLYLLGLKKK